MPTIDSPPDWIWYVGDSNGGPPKITFGHWPKYEGQRKYMRLADTPIGLRTIEILQALLAKAKKAEKGLFIEQDATEMLVEALESLFSTLKGDSMPKSVRDEMESFDVTFGDVSYNVFLATRQDEPCWFIQKGSTLVGTLIGDDKPSEALLEAIVAAFNYGREAGAEEARQTLRDALGL